MVQIFESSERFEELENKQQAPVDDTVRVVVCGVDAPGVSCMGVRHVLDAIGNLSTQPAASSHCQSNVPKG